MAATFSLKLTRSLDGWGKLAATPTFSLKPTRAKTEVVSHAPSLAFLPPLSLMLFCSLLLTTASNFRRHNRGHKAARTAALENASTQAGTGTGTGTVTPVNRCSPHDAEAGRNSRNELKCHRDRQDSVPSTSTNLKLCTIDESIAELEVLASSAQLVCDDGLWQSAQETDSCKWREDAAGGTQAGSRSTPADTDSADLDASRLLRVTANTEAAKTCGFRDRRQFQPCRGGDSESGDSESRGAALQVDVLFVSTGPPLRLQGDGTTPSVSRSPGGPVEAASRVQGELDVNGPGALAITGTVHVERPLKRLRHTGDSA